MHRRFAKEGPARWLGFVLLGVAGVLVTIAGIYELQRGSARPAADPAPAAFQSAVPAETDELKRLRAENRQLQIDAARQRHREFLQERPGTRCVGGVLFREVEGALTNVGKC